MHGKSKAKTPAAYIAELEEPRRAEIKKIDALIRKTVPKLKPHILGGMLAYGPIQYRTKSGRESDWFKIGVASQKNYISIYFCAADDEGYAAERFKERLPKANIGKSCVRFKRLDDLDPKALSELMKLTAKMSFGA
jgi:hypothetical protein